MGLAVAEGGQPPQAHAAHAVKLVDTHGAGDKFIGALAAQLAQGASLLESLALPVFRRRSLSAHRLTRKISHIRPRNAISL